MNKTASAKIKYLRIGPRKMVGLCKLIRGKDVLVAKSVLLRTPKKGARLIEKALASVIANAKNKNMDEKRLIVKEIRADLGPSYKRYIPWSRGSPRPIKKRTTHLTIVLEEGEKKIKNQSLGNTRDRENKKLINSEIQKAEKQETQENIVETGSESPKKEAKPVKEKKTRGGVKVKVKTDKLKN